MPSKAAQAMGKLRWKGRTKQERQEHCRMMGKASAKRRALKRQAREGESAPENPGEPGRDGELS